jgi:class 3 adenylate cyclase
MCMANRGLVKPHYKSVIFASYLGLLREKYPHVDIAAIAKEAGLSLEYISDENNWVSITYEKRIMDLIAERTGDPDIFFKAGQFGVSKTGLGSGLHFLATNVISLDTIYRSLPKLTTLLNKVMDVRILDFEPGKILFSFTPISKDLLPEEAEILASRMPIIMSNTQGYYSAIPTLKRLPAAEVTTTLINPENHTYGLEVNYFARSETLNSIAKIAPAVVGLVVMCIAHYFYDFDAMSSTLMAGSFFAGLISIYLFLSVKALKSISRQAEESLFKLDTQYKDLYSAKTLLNRKLEETHAIYDLVSNLISSSTEEQTIQLGCEALVTNLDYDRAFVLLKDQGTQNLKLKGQQGFGPDLLETLRKLELPIDIKDDDPSRFSNVLRFNKPLLVKDVKSHLKTLSDPLSKRVLEMSKSQSFVVAPICTNTSSFGLLVADCANRSKIMTEDDLRLISTAAHQMAIAIEQQRSKQELVDSYENEVRLSESYSRFVPFETLKMLNYKSIHDVRIGDGIETTVSVLFSDIRDFTTLCESMTTREILLFLNSYYAEISPVIKANGGTIDKFMGDGVMALFPAPESALKAAIEIQRVIIRYNLQHRQDGRVPIRAGVGIASGPVVFGPLGSEKRLELTAISDTVNVASRLDGLCRTHEALILVSGFPESALPQLGPVRVKALGGLQIKGKSIEIQVQEIIDEGLLENVDKKSLTPDQLSYVDELERKITAKIESCFADGTGKKAS